jgi:hypothetical protein
VGMEMPVLRGGELVPARSHTAAPRRAAWAVVYSLLLSAGRALTPGDGGATDVLRRPGGTRRASGRRTRRGIVAAEARRTRNGVYLMVTPARVPRRAHPLVRVVLVAIVLLGIWFFLQADLPEASAQTLGPAAAGR